VLARKRTVGDEVIVGLGGDDVILALGGDDCLLGGNGDDTLNGGPGPDLLSYRYSASRCGSTGRAGPRLERGRMVWPLSRR
jgi:Ca2+-binding RTX toxin-like protein